MQGFGAQAPEKMPSLAARSAPVPSSTMLTVAPPGVIVTVSPRLAGFAHFTLSAAIGIGFPACVPSGRRTPKNPLREHVAEPKALMRRPVTVRPASDDFLSAPVTMRFRSCDQVRVVSCARRSAASPATCGVAIDVPEKKEYVLFGVVLSTRTPGAPTSTVRAPKLENPAMPSLWSVAATAITFGRK